MSTTRVFDPSVYRKEWQWKEGDYTVTRTTQWSGPGCHDGCGVLIFTDKDGKFVKMEGDPNNPYNKGRLCMRCLGIKEAIEHKDRQIYPLKRVGGRGSNKWERITWDEALNTIEKKVKHYTETYGSHSIGCYGGTGRNAFWQLPSIARSVFETPHATSFISGNACYLPRITIMNLVAGDAMVADCAQMYEESFNHPEWKAPEVMIQWGVNTVISNSDGFYGHWIIDLMKQGTKFITIDPSMTWIAAKSDYFLQIRPGTDGALALAMLNVIINEDLYDHDFVENWTYGFEQLAERVQEYTPEFAAKVCEISKDIIIESARAFAKAKPASIHWGVALDMIKHGVAAAHAIMCLWAITGNLDVPGGNILMSAARWQAECAAFFAERSPQPKVGKPGAKRYPLIEEIGGRPSWDWEMLLMGDEKYNPLEDPYKIRMLYTTNSNSFAGNCAEAPRAFEALNNLEFVVCADYWITPTVSALADIFLPLSMSCERDSMRSWWAPLRTISKVVTPPGECKSDEEILLLLGKHFHPERFPWNDPREIMDAIMEARPDHLYKTTFNELEKKVYAYEGFEYKKYEKGLARADGEAGFNTATGLCELYISVFDAVGLDPLPYYREPTEGPVSTPELMEEYPFILTTGRRTWEFFHTEHRQLPLMREFRPDPMVEMNPEDAADLGLEDGDWIWIQNVHGKCKQKLYINEGMKKGVVSAEHGWWFPERDGSKEGGYYGAFESNINNLTTACDIGPTGNAAPYKTQICKVYKVTPENEKYELTSEEVKRSFEARRYLVDKPEKDPYA